ncbi:hypothetical protein [Telluribacter sp. SYSU D00476]|uniref:hypothetical protein n=1 Tax=Telluribacter sp. SYSU D00476 TaxID=2811430 RepID=UPI001FF393D6|nr:hypothetical protein [Telluribacter sp. SYSU D00476]
MTFSPYTLNGHQFSGVGVDLTPGNWRVSAMYGRLIKAQAGTETTPASYRRMGMGVKTQWQNNRFRLGVTTFRASDDSLSVDRSSPYTTVSPQQNLVLAVTAGASVFRIVQVDVEYSNSVLEKNRLLTEPDSMRSTVGIIGQPNASAESYNALKGTLNALLPKTNTTVGMGFERVDPNYQTLGGYFFTNDFSNVTVNASQTLWNGRLSGNANLGIQRDDLKNEKSSSQKRMVAGVHVMAVPSARLNLSVNYSNFKAYTFIRSALQDISRLSPLEQIDTLNFTQITRNLNANVVYQLQSSEASTQSIMVTYMVMNAANKQGDLIRTGQTTQVYNSNINYNWALPKLGFSLATGLSFNQNSVASQSFSAYGPTATVSKMMLKNRMNNSLSSSYLITRLGELNSSVTNLRYNAGFAPGKKQSFQLMVGSVFRGGKVSAGGTRNYVNATFGYSLRL